MIKLIQANQQLLIFSVMFLLVIVFLWILQYLVIQYGRQVFAQSIRYWLVLKELSGQSKFLIRLKNNYPRSSVFLQNRFERNHFYGLNLTLLVLITGYIFALFAGLLEDVATSDSIVAMDYFVSEQMSALRESNLVSLFILITSFGSTLISSLIIILSAFMCLIIRRPYIAIGLLVSTLGSTLFTFASKLLLQRMRPIDALLPEQTYSFPSGHATISIALFGFIAYVAIRFSQSYVRQVRMFFAALFFIALLGLSRIILNEHYLSDVMGGFLVGAFWLAVGISLTEWFTAKGKITWQLNWTVLQIYLLGLSVLGVLIGAVTYAMVYQFPFLL